jgi:hypothetical protein
LSGAFSVATGVFAVVPVKDLAGTKSRLRPILDPGARAGLTLYMMGRVVSALQGAGVEIVLMQARERGAVPLRQESRGLNPALEEGRRWAMDRGASTLLVLPADLPLLDPEEVRAVLEELGDVPSAVISPDCAHAGTNALLSGRLTPCRSPSAPGATRPTCTPRASAASTSGYASGPTLPSTSTLQVTSRASKSRRSGGREGP